MGVWDLMHLHARIKKFEKLAESTEISDSNHEYFLHCARQAQETFDRYTKRWEINAAWRRENPHGQRSE